MLIRHSRIPATLILLGAAVLCALYLRIYGRSVGSGDPSSLESIETAIATGNASPQVWRQYAVRLQAMGRPADAAAAYQKVLAGDPNNSEAQLGCARSLAAAGDDGGLYGLLKPLVYENPKMVVGFLEGFARRDTPPFDAMYREAVNQAMD